MAVDFTGLTRRNKTYAGANGSKISVIYQDEQYMLKFPPQATKNPDISYSNSCFSEYLGSKIFKSIGIPVQEVMLGTYRTEKGREKIVVACKDFAVGGKIVQDFASLKNQIIESEHNGYGTELEDIKVTFEEQTAMDPVVLCRRFWDMFIVDAFIGNWDRHNGNWGFLYDPITDKMELAPVFDCGSSLYPQADDQIMDKVLQNINELKARIYDTPTSAIRRKDKRIRYYQFISSLEDSDCNKALIRITPRINMQEIEQIIENTPFMSDLQIRFLKTMLAERKRRILDEPLEHLIARNGYLE